MERLFASRRVGWRFGFLTGLAPGGTIRLASRTNWRRPRRGTRKSRRATRSLGETWKRGIAKGEFGGFFCPRSPMWRSHVRGGAPLVSCGLLHTPNPSSGLKSRSQSAPRPAAHGDFASGLFSGAITSFVPNFSSIAPANAKSSSVSPPSLCVTNRNVTLL